MSILFTPHKIGTIEVKNRFVHSATGECMSESSGEITDALIKRYAALARGEVGLIVPGSVYVHPHGRDHKFHSGIHADAMIPGLRRLVRTVHDGGSKIFFQLIHAGTQTAKELIECTPMGPSPGFDAAAMSRSRRMSEEDIRETIVAFSEAARRTVETGADGIQLHAANGFLINQFLSPYFNRRTDGWGGSDENRFRFLKEVVIAIREKIGNGIPVIVKLNTNEYYSKKGITPELAKKYCGWLAGLGIDGIEIASGLGGAGSFLSIARGGLPLKGFLMKTPAMLKPIGWIMLKNMARKYPLTEGYNLDFADIVRPVIGELPLIVVGGMRSVAGMEEAVGARKTDFISMCRPFIREPLLVRKVREGAVKIAGCTSCNECFAALYNDMPVRCYQKKI